MFSDLFARPHLMEWLRVCVQINADRRIQQHKALVQGVSAERKLLSAGGAAQRRVVERGCQEVRGFNSHRVMTRIFMFCSLGFSAPFYRNALNRVDLCSAYWKLISNRNDMTPIKSALCIKLSKVALFFVEEVILQEIKPVKKRPVQPQINAHMAPGVTRQT